MQAQKIRITNLPWEVPCIIYRGGSRAATTSKMELFVVIINSLQPLAVITKGSTLDVAAVLDLPLIYPDYIPYNPCISLFTEP